MNTSRFERRASRDSASIAVVRASAWVLALTFAVAGCAPDSIKSNQATGFNGYLKKIGAVCKPLIIGDRDIGEALRLESIGDNSYDYFLDKTSQLYYNRISPANYRQNLDAFFGTGTYNSSAYDCLLNNLPADRPNAPM